jgi:tRNA A-37 threonylcarbamoyl transferase component Bud32
METKNIEIMELSYIEITPTEKKNENYKKNIIDFVENYKKIDIPEKYKNSNYIIKKNVTEKEDIIQDFLHNISLNNSKINVPNVYYYNKEQQIIVMRKIPALCLADMYGEEYDNIPNNIKQMVYDAICLMFYNNYYYPDITGYNFIYWQDKIWVIDFEHAHFDLQLHDKPSFMKDFVEGKVKGWNPDFM